MKKSLSFIHNTYRFKWWNLTQALSFMWLRKIANAYFWNCKLENKGIYSKCEQPSTQKFIPMRISVAYWKLLEIVIIYIIISKQLPKFYWSGILIKFPLSLVVIWQAKTYLSEPKLAWSWAQNKQTILYMHRFLTVEFNW